MLSEQGPAELVIWTSVADGYLEHLETELKSWAARERLPSDEVRLVRSPRPHIPVAVVVANAAGAVLWSLHRRAAAAVLQEAIRRGYSVYVENQPLLDRQADEAEARRRSGLPS